MDDTRSRPPSSHRGNPGPHVRHPASRRSRRGLDWFVFFVADVQTGFGPFIAVYLTSQKWTQVDIGFVLTVGGLISLFGQIPGGALLDALNSPRLAAAVAVTLVGLSALILAIWPTYPAVLASRVLQAGASCVLGPAIAAISLGLVPRERIGLRLGRNACFASIGTGLAAALMGACGYYISDQAVFFVTAALALPALVALLCIRSDEIDPLQAHGGAPVPLPPITKAVTLLSQHHAIVIFAICVFLFHLANAAVLPLIAGTFTLRSSQSASALIATAMVVPQFLVAVTSPLVGLTSRSWGRRPLLLIGFAALLIRIALIASVTDLFAIVAIQVFDGISAAILGVLVPLCIADLTRNTGHFNLVQGVIGCAMGLGASISTTLGGFLSDRFSSSVALFGLDAIAAIGLITIWLAMPETRDHNETESNAATPR